jgi:uridine phosphorylase
MPLPIFAGKHRIQALVNPPEALRHLGWDPLGEPFPETAVMIYSRPLGRQLLRRYPEARRRQVPGIPDLYEVPMPGGPVALAGGFGIGGPAAAVVLEQLVAVGVRQVVSVGGAGGLDAALAIGDVVVCDRALRDEGVSYHYLPPEERFVHPDPELTGRLVRALNRRVADGVRVAGTWTTDAPYRETRAEVDSHRAEGVFTVEMEAASLAAVARHRGVRFAAAFAIMDSLAGDAWRPEGLRHTDAYRSLITVFEAAADAMAAPELPPALSERLLD